jgi:hypothetical protein
LRSPTKSKTRSRLIAITLTAKELLVSVVEPTAAWYLLQIEGIQGLSEMISNPSVLRIVVDVLPSIVKGNASKDSAAEKMKLSFSDVYEAFAYHWFDRQLEKQIQVKHGRNNTGAFFRYAIMAGPADAD